MLGLDGVVDVAHHAEDLLGALRDGRFPVRKDHVDLMLVAAESIGRSLPGAAHPGRPPRSWPLSWPPWTPPARATTRSTVPAARARPTTPTPATPTGRAAATRSGCRPGGSTTCSTSSARPSWTYAAGRGTAASWRRWRPSSCARPRALRDALAAGRPPRRPRRSRLHRSVALGDQLTAADPRAARPAPRRGRAGWPLVRDGAMGLAMVPVRRVVAGVPAARPGARRTRREDPQGRLLVLVGQDVELDTRVLDAVADSLRHLVTNAVDHGCESAGRAAAAGKPAAATVSVPPARPAPRSSSRSATTAAASTRTSLRAAAVARGLLPADSTATGPALLQGHVRPGLLDPRRGHPDLGPRRRARRRTHRRRGPQRHHRGRGPSRAPARRSSSPCRSPSASCAA